MSPQERPQTGDGSSRPQSVLEHMYMTGEWSDLTIKSREGDAFNVHKSVVCAASPFFHAACKSKSGVRKTHSNVIELPENRHTVDAILRHFYSLPIFWIEPRHFRFDFTIAINEGLGMIRLGKAIDKYGVYSLAATVEKALSTFLFRAVELGKHDVVVYIGCQLFDESCDIFQASRFDVLRATAELVPAILCNDKTFKMWHGNAEYMQRTLMVREEMRLAELE